MIGFLVFALPVIGVIALFAGEWEAGLVLLAGAAWCLLLVSKHGQRD